MAYANESRTASLPRQEGIDILETIYGFQAWSIEFPRNGYADDIPSLLAFDGLILVPNLKDRRLEAFDIAAVNGSPHPKWSVGFSEPPTYASTPVYYGLHLFYAVRGAIRRVSVLDGKVEEIQMNNITPSHIVPVPGCAPLLFYYNANGRLIPFMLVVLQNDLLFYNLESRKAFCQSRSIFPNEDVPRSPVFCENYIILTSKGGTIFSFDLNQKPLRSKLISARGFLFSAPVAINGKIYFETVEQKTGLRSIKCYEKETGQLSSIPLGNSNNNCIDNLEGYQSVLIRSPLTNGSQLFLSDQFGKIMYVYTDGILESHNLTSKSRGRFVPHRSIVVNDQIYSASRWGLTVFSVRSGESRPISLARGGFSNPSPIAPPIRYGDKLFVLCEDRLVCMSL